MKQHALMTAASLVFLIGCASWPSEKDLAEDKENFEFIRGCGDAKGVSRSIVEYACKYLDCRLKTCYIKLCGEGFELTDLELSETECKAELKTDDN